MVVPHTLSLSDVTGRVGVVSPVSFALVPETSVRPGPGTGGSRSCYSRRGCRFSRNDMGRNHTIVEDVGLLLYTVVLITITVLPQF